ncbi:Ankyrin repeat domain-containing protein 17 [Durusdinium trenchii]|uniref:Ankyrin repeat domain-containing protein 17 n=1 Tax=Durusdinium trenchii TaxID=1381693 RepID=A0ABP0QG16_9DINO
MALTRVVAALLMCEVFAEPSLQGSAGNTTGVSITSSLRASRSWPHPGCCSGCIDFCSPFSGRCYDKKGKYYYLECSTSTGETGGGGEHQDCCSNCGAFCSPKSGKCYLGKGETYYLDCRTYIFAGRRKCNLNRGNGMIDYSPQVGSATECRVACQNTPGCTNFQFAAADTACSVSTACQLFSKSCYSDSTEDPCWELYALD